MSAASPETVTGNATLRVGGEEMTLEVTVPAAATALTGLLPIFNAVTSALVERAVARDVDRGRTVSCRAGCGACCRQPVPVAPSEARALAALVDALPEPRRTIVRDRFAAAQATLAAAGIGTTAEHLVPLSVAERMKWGIAYLAARVACPFLDDEACSIYPDRPTICREYLVTTPAENCWSPSPGTIRRVPLPGSVSSALFAVDVTLEGHGRLMLIDSLAWVAAHPAPTPTQSGPTMVQAVFATLAAKS